MKILLSLAVLFATAFTSWTLSVKPHSNRQAAIIPNRLWIPVNSSFRSNMSEADFNSVLKKVYARHQTYFKAHGYRLRIHSDWIDGTANAFADRDGDTFTIEVFGGLARHPLITKDGFTLLVCHEMGHHLGGAPTGLDLGWPSYEGQSDYFSTLKCLRRIFVDENNESVVRRQFLDPVLITRCQTAYQDRLSQLICVRSGQAAMSVANFFHSIEKRGPAPSFARRDPTEVPKTRQDHAGSQCRLDTYMAGALCHADPRTNPDPHKHDVGVCTEQNDLNGARPRCWYKPVSQRSRFRN